MRLILTLMTHADAPADGYRSDTPQGSSAHDWRIPHTAEKSRDSQPDLPEKEAQLREVLGAAALSAGLTLAPPACDGVITARQAERAATAWGWADGDRPPAVVVLVDGLGLDMLRERKGHVPTLRRWLAECTTGMTGGGEGRTCVPSTTAAALTTLGTGAAPAVTGMVGYCVLNPSLDRQARGLRDPSPADQLCLITWAGNVPQPRTWQDIPTIFERLRFPDGDTSDVGNRSSLDQSAPMAVTIGPSRFAHSGLTEAGLRGASHLGADAMEARPGLAAQALRRGVRLVYLYVGELDHAGHAHGWMSAAWLEQLERLDAMLADLQRRVPAGTRIILTADHGMIDTDAEHRVIATDYPELCADVTAIAGEPRFTQLYVPYADPERAEAVAQRWRETLGERARWVSTRDQAHELLGPVSSRAHSVLGDVLVAMAGAWVVVDPRVHSPQAMAMPGVHGSLSDAEMRVPLLSVRV